MKKQKIIHVGAACDILRIKKENQQKTDEELLKIYLEKANLKKKKDKIEAMKAANFALKIKKEKNLVDKKVIQEVLDNLI